MQRPCAHVQQGIRVFLERTIDAAFEDELIREDRRRLGASSRSCTGSCNTTKLAKWTIGSLPNGRSAFAGGFSLMAVSRSLGDRRMPGRTGATTVNTSCVIKASDEGREGPVEYNEAPRRGVHGHNRRKVGLFVRVFAAGWLS